MFGISNVWQSIFDRLARPLGTSIESKKRYITLEKEKQTVHTAASDPLDGSVKQNAAICSPVASCINKVNFVQFMTLYNKIRITEHNKSQMR